MTGSQWGVGSTDPYLHDGRATTLDEAIRAHGTEAYLALDEDQRTEIVAFLEDMVLFRDEEDEEEAQGALAEEEPADIEK